MAVVKSQAQNALLASEDFSAATGALHNSASGSGWLAAWATQNNNTAVPGYNIANTAAPQYAGLLSSGNYAVGGNAYQSTGRHLNVNSTGPFASYLTTDGNIGVSGKTVFMSVVLRKDANNTDPVYVLLHRNTYAYYVNDNVLAIGYFGSASENGGIKYWSIKIGSTVYRSNVAVTVGQAALLVLKVDFAATSTATLFVNPTSLGSTAPATANVSTTTTSIVTFKALAYYGGNGTAQSAIDEIRIGESFSAVTPTASSGVVLRNPENPANAVAGLDYNYYEGSWNTLPDFSALTAVKTGTTSTFDLTPRNRDNDFALVFTGYINVPTDGVYTFFTESDDGSKLLIGTTEVVNNDGLHAVTEVSGSIGLKAGKHAIKVAYFELNGGEILNVQYQGPGIAKQAIPASALYRASTTVDTAAPSIPTALVASAITTSSFTLSWAASTDNVGVTGYEVFQNGVSLGVATGTSRSIAGLAAATAYSMTVRARDAQGNWSAQSTAVTVTTTAANQPPSVPTGLAASAITQSSFTLTWTASTDDGGVTGYEVFRNGVSLGIATGTSRSITGLAAGTTYSVTVRATDAQSNWSAQSTALAVTTTANQAPSVPTGLVASAITQSSFTLTWTASTDDVGVTGYEVFRNGVSLGVATGTSRSITGLAAGTSYSMTVRATDALASWSAQSTALAVTTTANQAPSVPTGLVASAITQSSFTLTWTASTDDVAVTGYEVFQNGVSLGVATGTSRSITGLAAGTSYSMTVRATDALASWSAQSAALTVTTTAAANQPPSVPSGLTATSITQTSFTLSWSASTDDVAVTGYEVFQNGVSLGVATGTSRSITGLAAGTTYSMTVRATDAQASWSAQSTAYAVTTLPASSTSARSYNIGINTNPPNDWNIDNPFADVMRTHRQWKEFGNGSGDGISTIPLDANGWPMTDGTALVFHGARRIHGSYKLSFNGTATVSVSASATISNVQYNSATNTTTADITIPSASAIDLWVTFTNSKRTSASATNTGVTNVKIMRPVSPGSAQSYSTDKIFNDEYTNKLAPFKVIRFMGWMETNWNDEETWDNHTRWSYATQQRKGANGPYGASWESVILLANATGKDAWITLPHKATDDYITKVAQTFLYGSDGSNPYTSPQANPVIPPLNPGLKLYVEYSNEIWNNDFSQTEYTRSRGASYGHPLNFDGETDRVTLGFRFKAMRTVQISNIFRNVFGNDQMMTRVRPVICWQIAYTDLTNRTLSFIDRYYNKRDSRSDWSDPHPVNYYLYGGGGSGYWYVSSSSGLTTSNIWDNGDWNPSNYANTLFADASWAKAFGLTYLAYEGDNHPIYTGDEPIMQQIHWDSRMYQETQEHLEAFSSLDGDAFCFLVLQNVSPAVWGVFNLADGLASSPQYQAIQAMSGTPAAALSKGSVIPFTRAGGAYDVATYQRPNPNGSGTFNLTGNGSEYAVAYTFRTTTTGSYNVQVEYSSTTASRLAVEYAGNVVGTFNLSSSGGAAAFTTAITINVTADKLYALRLVCTSGSVVIRNISITAGSATGRIALSAATTEITASAYPNPVNNVLAVSIQGSNNEVANVTISDLMGVAKLSTQRVLADGDNILQIDTSMISAGVYLLTIEKGGKSTQIRLLIAH